MDVGKSVFAAGQTYVGLSRVKTLDGLYLSDFNPTRIRADPLVVEFYNSFPKVSAEFATGETSRILKSVSPRKSIASLSSSLTQTTLTPSRRPVSFDYFKNAAPPGSGGAFRNASSFAKPRGAITVTKIDNSSAK
jgi:hypothetical protein